MKNQLKKNLSYKRTIIFLTLASLFFGLLSAILSEVFVPFAVAFCGALFLFEDKSKRLLSYAIPVLFIIFNIVMVLLSRQIISLWSIETICLSLIIYFGFTRKVDKGSIVAVMSVVVSLFLVLTFALFAMIKTETYTFDAVADFYKSFVGNIKNSFLSTFASISQSIPEGTAEFPFNSEEMGVLFDGFIRGLVSLFAIYGFAISGISLKIFKAIVIKRVENPTEISNWRFSTTNVFAYFYIVLVLVSFFITDTSTVLSVAIINLYNIFNVVYAYIGFNFALALISVRRSPTYAFIILSVLVILFSSFAVDILAMLGIFFTISKNNGNIIVK